MKHAPIVLFVYNRPWHTQQTVEGLLKNDEVKLSDLIVYSDAAKTVEQEKSVQEVRDYIDGISGFKSIKIIKQESNQGLAASIISGVTEVVNKYGRIIVLEDDIVTSPYFLKYMNEALEFYKDEDKIMHISSYQIIPSKKIQQDTFLLRFMSCWGWATWKQSWENFERKPKQLLEKLNSSNEWNDFRKLCSIDNYRQVEMNVNEEIQTWAVFWAASIFENEGLCVYPKYTMSKNIGLDGSGINCIDSKKKSLFIENKPVKNTTVKYSRGIEKLYGETQEKLNQPILSIRLKDFIKNLIRYK